VPLSDPLRRLVLTLLALLMSGGFAVAQVAGPGDDERPSGDIITLTSGAQMSGVQVLRKTATSYHVQIVEGVVMEIPVSQVREIEYDENRRSTGSRGGAGTGTGANGEEIRAQEMAPALNKVLTQPLETPLAMDEQDLLVILEMVGHQFGFSVEIREPIYEIPPDERRWAFEVPAGATLLRLFRDDFAARFPALVAVPQFDRVVVTTKVDAEESGLIDAAPDNNDVVVNDGAVGAPSGAP